jgi:hypothetical protein
METNIHNESFWYKLIPNTVGCLSSRSVADLDQTRDPSLELEIDLPIRADLFNVYEFTFVTADLRQIIEAAAIASIQFKKCVLKPTDEFMECYSSTLPFPSAFRLISCGTRFVDDIAFDELQYPIVSGRFIELLNRCRYNHHDTKVLAGAERAERLIASRRSSFG